MVVIVKPSKKEKRFISNIISNDISNKFLICYISDVPKENFVWGRDMDKTQIPQEKSLLMKAR